MCANRLPSIAYHQTNEMGNGKSKSFQFSFARLTELGTLGKRRGFRSCTLVVSNIVFDIAPTSSTDI